MGMADIYTHLELWVCLSPGIFIFHEFEEMLFLQPWFRKHKSLLQSRFPHLTRRLVPIVTRSSRAFTAAVCEEFLLLSLVSWISFLTGWYALWFGLLTAFTLHLIVHILQAVVLRKYVPALLTAMILLPVCGYAWLLILQSNLFSVKEIIGWSWIGMLIAGSNLWLAHRITAPFDRQDLPNNESLEGPSRKKSL